MIKRDIIPFFFPGSEFWIKFFEASTNPTYKEISRILVIAKDWDDYFDMVRKTTSTGMYAQMGAVPWIFNWNKPEEEFKEYYRSSETVEGISSYGVHIENKKWPLKKVLV